MKTSNIAKLTANDGWDNAAKKINTNFENLRKSLETNVRTGAGIDVPTIIGLIEPIVEARVLEQVYDDVMPVGSIVAFKDNRTPTSHGLRGTWQRVFQDRLLLGAGTAYTPGELYGDSKVPRHKHSVSVKEVEVDKPTSLNTVSVLSVDPDIPDVISFDTGYTGSSVQEELLPPSVAVSFWERIA